MKLVTAIMKKELKSLFYSPVAYAIGALLLVFSGIFFSRGALSSGFAGIVTVFGPVCFFILPIAIPLITMKSISEEKKTGTIELLFTMPVKTKMIILGKYFALSIVFLLIIGVTLIHTLVLVLAGNPELGVTFSIYFGVILQGLALISIGLFISTLTDSQVVAGIASFGIGVLLVIINILADSSSATLKKIFIEISFYTHLIPFFRGIIDLKDIAFYLLIIILGITLSMNHIENEKWRK